MDSKADRTTSRKESLKKSYAVILAWKVPLLSNPMLFAKEILMYFAFLSTDGVIPPITRSSSVADPSGLMRQEAIKLNVNEKSIPSSIAKRKPSCGRALLMSE